MRTFVCVLLFLSFPAWPESSTALGYYRLIEINDHLIHSVLDTERQQGRRIIQLSELSVRSKALLRAASDVLREAPMRGEEETLRVLRVLASQSDDLVTDLR